MHLLGIKPLNIEWLNVEQLNVEQLNVDQLNVKQGIINFLKHQTTERPNAQRQTTERGIDWTSNFPASDATVLNVE